MRKRLFAKSPFVLFAALAAFWAGLPDAVHSGEGSLKNQRKQDDELTEQAQQYFEDYVLSQEELPRSLVVVGKGKLVSLSKGELAESKICFVHFRQRVGNTGMRRFTGVSNQTESSARYPYWRQRLENEKGWKFYRGGIQRPETAAGLVHAIDPPDTEPEDAQVPKAPYKVDPYTLPVAMASVRRKSGAILPLLFHLYRIYDVKEATYESDGKLTGTFALDDTMNRALSITFDPKMGNMPVRAVLFEVLKPPEGEEDLKPKKRIFERIDSVWREIDLGDGETKWLPISFRSIAKGHQYLMEDVRFFRWRLGDEESTPFPNVDDPNWLSGISETMGIDWLTGWEDFEVHGSQSLKLMKMMAEPSID